MAAWSDVDAFLDSMFAPEDETLVAIRAASREAGLPEIEVSAGQGQFLAVLTRLVGAKRVLEVGTLGGYSTVWFARAIPADGRVTTLELDPVHAETARSNFDRAGLADRIDLLEGPADASLRGLVDAGTEPYDLVFIDANKDQNPEYLAAAMELTVPGSVIVVDNVVRFGRVVEADSEEPHIVGTRAVLAAMADDPRLDATAMQTVGGKAWDGFALARVVDPDAGR